MFSTAVYFAVYYWQAIYSGIFSRLELLPRHALARRRRHRFPPEARARCSLPRFVSALAKPFLCSLVSRSASPIYLLGSGCHGFLDSRPAGAPPSPPSPDPLSILLLRSWRRMSAEASWPSGCGRGRQGPRERRRRRSGGRKQGLGLWCDNGRGQGQGARAWVGMGAWWV